MRYRNISALRTTAKRLSRPMCDEGKSRHRRVIDWGLVVPSVYLVVIQDSASRAASRWRLCTRRTSRVRVNSSKRGAGRHRGWKLRSTEPGYDGGQLCWFIVSSVHEEQIRGSQVTTWINNAQTITLTARSASYQPMVLMNNSLNYTDSYVI